MPRLRCLALVLGLTWCASASAQEPDRAAQSTADRELERGLRAAFSEIGALREVTVEVRAGVVSLKGKAPSVALRETAERIANRPGVIFVNSDIAVAEESPAKPVEQKTSLDEEIQQQLEAIFSRVESLSAVKIKASSGVVSLTGEASSEEARKKAEELARGMKGAVFVDNQIASPKDVKQQLAPSLLKLRDLGRKTWGRLPIFGIAAGVVLAFWLLSKLVGKIGFGFRKNKLLQGLVRQAARFSVVLIGVFIALDLLEATALVGAILGTAGVVGLAIGFAFRDIVENYLMSVLLSFRQPFEIDDFVEINGQQGTILSLTTSETVLMTPDGNHLRFPNSVVFKSTLINYTRNPLRRLDFNIGVGVHEDLVKVQEDGLQVLKDMPGVIDDPPPSSFVDSLGDSSVSVQFLGWVDQRKSSFAKVRSQAMRLVKERFDERGIAMPLPGQALEILMVDPAEAKKNLKDKLRRRSSKAEASIDVSVDDELKDQLQRERAASEGLNLLSAGEDRSA